MNAIRANTIAARGLAADLAAREEAGKPIRVGIIGCGEMGTDLVTQIARMKGLRVGAIADRSGRNAQEAIRIAGHEADHGAAVGARAEPRPRTGAGGGGRAGAILTGESDLPILHLSEGE